MIWNVGSTLRIENIKMIIGELERELGETIAVYTLNERVMEGVKLRASSVATEISQGGAN